MANQKKTPHINLPIDKLQLNNGQLDGLGKNPRFIRDEKFGQLKKSLEESPEFLDARPLLVYPLTDGKFITVAGNMRLRAARELGFKEVPCYVFPKETPVEKLREYAIKDNVAFGEIDYEILKDDWDAAELSDWGVDVPDFLENEDEPPQQRTSPIDDDDFDEDTDDVPKRCIRGDIWQLGGHRLMCGDSTKEEDVAALLGETNIDMVFTDPPYGIAYGGVEKASSTKSRMTSCKACNSAA